MVRGNFETLKQLDTLLMMPYLEVVARQIAADTMRLVADKHGLRLPDDLWQQAIGKAQEKIANDFGLK
jgi:hypothetical protein